MKGFFKTAVVLSAVTAGTVWALKRYAPEVWEQAKASLNTLKHKAEAAVSSATAVDRAAYAEEAADEEPSSAEDEPAEEPAEPWPDLSRIPGTDGETPAP